MKTGDYKRIFSRKEEHPHEHGDSLKKSIHENRHTQGLNHIRDHKFSLNHEQVMDMHDRERNRTHS